MSKDTCVENANYTGGANYIHRDTTSGENSDVIIEHVDGDFPLGEMSQVEANQVADDWLGVNYPGVTHENLSQAGINVSFIPGETTYYLDGKEVSEEEYNTKVDELGLNSVVESPNINEDVLYKTVGLESNGTASDIKVGEKYTSNGQIRITVDGDAINQLNTSTLDDDARKSLNELIENNTGIKDAIKSGTTIKGAYDTVKEYMDPDGSGINVKLMFAALIVDPALDITNLQDFWDADDSDLADNINKLAKGGKYVFAALALAGSATGISEVVVGAGAVISALVDGLIKDGDQQDIIKLDADNNLEWDFDYTTSSGQKGHYNKEIKISDDPTTALNELYSYLEMAKVILVNRMREIESRRDGYIKSVQSSIGTEMQELDIATASETECKRLWQIYEIDGNTLTSDDITYNDNTDTSSNINISLSDESPIDYYTIKFKYDTYYGITLTQNRHTTAKDETLVTFALPEYTGSGIDESTIYKGKTKYSDEGVNQIGIDFIKSVYNYHYKNSGRKKNEFINGIADDKNVKVGEVDLYTIGNHDIKINNSYFDNIDSSYEQTANDNNACYISESRINLAKKLTGDFYVEILTLGGWHSDFIQRMKKEDRSLAAAIDDTYCYHW